MQRMMMVLLAVVVMVSSAVAQDDEVNFSVRDAVRGANPSLVVFVLCNGDVVENADGSTSTFVVDESDAPAFLVVAPVGQSSYPQNRESVDVPPVLHVYYEQGTDHENDPENIPTNVVYADTVGGDDGLFWVYPLSTRLLMRFTNPEVEPHFSLAIQRGSWLGIHEGMFKDGRAVGGCTDSLDTRLIPWAVNQVGAEGEDQGWCLTLFTPAQRDAWEDQRRAELNPRADGNLRDPRRNNR